MVNALECYCALFLRTNILTVEFNKLHTTDLLLAKIWFIHFTEYSLDFNLHVQKVLRLSIVRR